MLVIEGPSPFGYRGVILNKLLEYARNEFTNSVLGLLLMIAIYECSCDILALEIPLKIIDCDGSSISS